MNNKYYVGKQAQNFEQYDDITISGISLKDDKGNQYSAGDQDGYILQINCKYATPQMANDLFDALGGKVYKGYRATDSILDPMAELGDGITINGLYSMLAYRRVNFGPEHMSEIAAPGDSAMLHEFQFENYTQKDIEKGKEESRIDAKEIADKAVDEQTQEDVFNKLTNGGQDQGLFLDNGKVYLNLEYVKSDIIDLNVLRLAGTICGIIQGYGSTYSGNTTQGIVVYGNGINDKVANPPYIIVTNAGIRLQSTANNQFNVAGTVGEMVGTIRATADVTAEGNVSAGKNLYAGKKLAANYAADTDLMTFGNNAFRSWLSGRQVYVGEDVSGYETYLRGGTIYSSKTIQTSSDERSKKDISPIPEKFEEILDHMTPVMYRYKNEDDDAPVHMGYIAQEFSRSVSETGIKTNLAVLGKRIDDDGEEKLSLAYEELIALLHMKINQLEKEIKTIKEELQ